MVHKGRTSCATSPLDCNISYSLKYTNFLLSGVLHPIHAFILHELGCVNSLRIWNVNKEGLAGEAEEGTEAAPEIWNRPDMILIRAHATGSFTHKKYSRTCGLETSV